MQCTSGISQLFSPVHETENGSTASVPGRQNLELHLGRWALDAFANLPTVSGPRYVRKKPLSSIPVIEINDIADFIGTTFSSLGTNWGRKVTLKFQQNSKISSPIECNSGLGLKSPLLKFDNNTLQSSLLNVCFQINWLTCLKPRISLSLPDDCIDTG